MKCYELMRITKKYFYITVVNFFNISLFKNNFKWKVIHVQNFIKKYSNICSMEIE